MLDNTFLTEIQVAGEDDVKTPLVRLETGENFIKIDGFKLTPEDDILKFRLRVGTEVDVVAVTAAGAAVLRDDLTAWLDSLS